MSVNVKGTKGYIYTLLKEERSSWQKILKKKRKEKRLSSTHYINNLSNDKLYDIFTPTAVVVYPCVFLCQYLSNCKQYHTLWFKCFKLIHVYTMIYPQSNGYCPSVLSINSCMYSKGYVMNSFLKFTEKQLWQREREREKGKSECIQRMGVGGGGEEYKSVWNISLIHYNTNFIFNLFASRNNTNSIKISAVFCSSTLLPHVIYKYTEALLKRRKT